MNQPPEHDAARHECCVHCLPKNNGAMVTGRGQEIPDVPELLAMMREAHELRDGPRQPTSLAQIRERAAQLSDTERAELQAVIDRAEATLAAMPQHERDQLAALATEAEHSRHEYNPSPGCALCTTGRDGRRIFVGALVLGDGAHVVPASAEPVPAVPVRSVMIVWTRRDDGLWRAVDSPSDEPHAYGWFQLLETFRRLAEVLPGELDQEG